LIEPGNSRRLAGGLIRIWYTSTFMDLYLFVCEDETVEYFQLCYDKDGDERVLVWGRGRGFGHAAIDAGEGVPGKARTPIIVADGVCDIDRLRGRFRNAARGMPRHLFEQVYRRLLEYHLPGSVTSNPPGKNPMR